MSKLNVTRRDFLKIATAAPLLAGGFSHALDRLGGYTPDPSSPNFLIIVFDAFSAKNASLYGYDRFTTPNLERLAGRGIVYHNHISAGNFTTPGTASLLTGTYPWTHRAIHLQGSVEKSTVPNNLFKQFADKRYTRLAVSHNLLVTTLLYQFIEDIELFKWPREVCLEDNQFSERLFARDYNIAYLGEKTMMPIDTDIAGSLFLSILLSWAMTDEKRRLEKILKNEYPDGIPGHYGNSYLLEPAIDWVIQTIPSLPQPFLAYVHLLPPHEPYLPRKEFSDMFIDNWKPLRKPKAYFTQGYAQQDLNHARRDYDSLIANVDAEFGRLMDILDATGLRDNTYVILTSDHGELFERGIQGHTTQAMYQPIIQIPMIIYPPGQKERKDVFVNTSCVDLLPTLLHLAGIAVPDRCEGQILPPFRDSEMPDERSLFTMDAKTTPKLAPFKKASFAVIRGSYKLIHNMGYGRDVPLYEMYNLMEDPDELENRSSIDKGITQEYMDILQEKIKLANQRV